MHDDQRQALRLAYIAGLFDGEGSFIFRKSETPNLMKQTKRINPMYYGTIRIGMVEKEALEYIEDMLPGGNLTCEGVRKGRENCQIMYRWNINRRQRIIEVIPLLLPYLIIKKQQAQILLDVLSNWEIPYNRKDGLSPKELQRRELAWQKMRQLNRKI
jgi:hypothetical protein